MTNLSRKQTKAGNLVSQRCVCVRLQFYALGVPKDGGGLNVYVAVSDPDEVIRVAAKGYKPNNAIVMRVVEAVIIESLIHLQRTNGLVTLVAWLPCCSGIRLNGKASLNCQPAQKCS